MLYLLDTVFLTFTVIILYFMVFFMVLYFSEKKKIKPDREFLEKVSFIVPAHNEEDTIKQTVEAIKNTDYPDKEIIVVDDGSTDNTAKIARSLGVKVFSKAKGGKASALNYGIKKATWKIVACVDSDSYPRKDSVKKAMNYFSDPEVASVTTSIFTKNNKKLIERLQEFEYMMIAWTRKNLEEIDSIYVTPGPLAFYRKDVLKKIGGFDEKNLTEDIEIAWNLLSRGYKIRMAEDSVTVTEVPSSFRKWCRQRIRWNIGGLQTLNKYKGFMLKKGMGIFSSFVVPFFTFSIVISILGLLVFSYVIMDSLVSITQLTMGMYSAGLGFRLNINIMHLPSIFMVFGLLIFLFSLVYIRTNLGFFDRRIRGRKDYLTMLIYLTFYITIFPILLIVAIYKCLARVKEW